MKKRNGQMRILEAIIACGLIIMSYTFLSKSSSFITTQNSSELKNTANNVLNVLENDQLLISIQSDELNWKTKLQEIISSTIPPNVYYNVTFKSITSNTTIGEPITNINDVTQLRELYSESIQGVYSFSYPIVQKTDVMIDVIMIMDRSGSMSWYIPGDPQPKIYYTKLAAKNFISRLNVTADKAGLTSFATDSRLDTILTNNYASVKTKIDSLYASGSTNLMGGINKANIEFQNNGRADSVKVMVILTDGKANWWDGNSGWQDERRAAEYAIEKADVAKSMGIKIFTIGLGAPDYLNETLLETIQTDGYFKAPSAQDLDTIYQTIADRIMSEVKYDTILIQVTVMKPLEGVTR
jgi:Mg-chelatase subunit ChlD